MPVLDVQRRGQQIGRIRIGQQVQAANGKMRPDRLDSFRFTTGSRVTAQAIAQLYGGAVRDWERGQFEVITTKSEIGVTVPPRDAIVSQWYEMWSKGGCQRRCDSQLDQISGGPCLCPHAKDPGDEDEVARCALERSRLSSLNPPQACKLVTRISVMIPDLPGLGVFRLDTGSFYAAAEIGDAGQLLQAARDQGVFLPAMLRIEQRQRVAEGKTKSYPVPVLEVLATFRDIATGVLEAGGIKAQLPPAPGEQPKAITAGTQSPVAQESEEPGPADSSNGNGRRPTGPAPAPPDSPGMTAEQIASLALTAAQSKEDIEALQQTAKDARCLEDHIPTDEAGEVYEELQEFLRARWKVLPRAGQAGA